MCKTRPYGCPLINVTSKRPSKRPTRTGWLKRSRESTHKTSSSTPTLTTFKLTKLHLTKFVDKISTQKPEKKFNEDLLNNTPKDDEEDTGLQILIQIAVALLIVTIILLVAAIIVKVCTHYNFRSERPVLLRSTSYATNPFKPEPSPEGI
jgi:hypothetical protein